MLPLERTDLGEDALALLTRAGELAHKHKHEECGLPHVIWAYLDGDPSKSARRVRVACRMAVPSLARAPDGAPPLAPALEAILHPDHDRETLFEAVCAAPLPPAIREPLLAHREAEPEPESAPAPEEEGEVVRWQRLEMDDGDGVRFVELTVDADRLYVRRGRVGHRPSESLTPEVEIKMLAGPVTAIRSFEKRIRNLKAKDFEVVTPVDRALPRESSADLRRRDRESKDADRKARFARLEHVILDLFERWHESGYDPTATFQAEAKRHERSPKEVTEAFLSLAAETLGVTFARRALDPVKSVKEPVGPRRLADFYIDPMRVARLADDKLRGELPKDHDGELPAWSSSKGRPVQLFDATSRALVRFRRTHGV